MLEAGVRSERQEKVWDQKDFAPIARLAETLRRAKFTNWKEVFNSPHSLLHTSRIGKVYREKFSQFREKVIAAHQRGLTNNKKRHTIEVASYGKKYPRKVYVIGGIPVVFISDDVNEDMEGLLKGESLTISGQILKSIRGDVRFLNEYFGLGISVLQKGERDGTLEVSLRKQKEIKLVGRQELSPAQ